MAQSCGGEGLYLKGEWGWIVGNSMAAVRARTEDREVGLERACVAAAHGRPCPRGGSAVVGGCRLV